MEYQVSCGYKLYLCARFTFSERREEVIVYRGATSTLSKDGNFVWISTKVLNVPLYPT